MNTLDTTQKALIYLGPAGDDSTPLLFTDYLCTTSDPAVVTFVDGGDFKLYCVAVAAGTATVTATRNSDGATATMLVTVTQFAGGPFEVHLGAPVPK